MYEVISKDKQIMFRDFTEDIGISVSKDNFHGLVQINEPPVRDYPKCYEDALSTPIKSEKLNMIAKGAKKVAIIVSDATRGVPNSKILPIVVRELKTAGIDEEQITVVVALGVHRAATQKEMDEILGNELAGKIKIINHDPYDENKLVYIGKTTYGTPIEVNRTVYEADLKIAIGKVEPHEFAGFSGGRKSVLPGICSEKTIKINHRPEMIMHEKAAIGIIEGNPISEDMLEGAKMLGIHFIINVVLNSAGEHLGVFAGDLEEAHLQAVEFLRSFSEVIVEDSPDIVVTTPGFPLNIDFYQSIKPIIALSPIMQRNSVIVLYTKCPDGFASDDMLKPYEGTTCFTEVIQNLTDNYKIQMDHALLLCKIMQKKINVIAYSPNIEAETLEKIGIIPAISPQDAVDKALGLFEKKNPKIMFFPQPQRFLAVTGLNTLRKVLSR